MSGLLVAIDPYIARLNAGVNEGFFGPINTTVLKLTQPDPEQVVRTSFLKRSYGQALDSYNRPQPLEIEFTIDECDPDLLAMGMLGKAATYAQAARLIGDPATDVVVWLDKWVSLSHNSLTEFAITGKTEGTDYEVEMEAGLLKALSTGTLTDGETVSYTAAATARAGHQIDAGTDSILQIGIRGPGKNLFTGKLLELEVWQANVSPSGGMDFISKDPISMTFKGTVIVPAGKPGPYRYTEYA